MFVVSEDCPSDSQKRETVERCDDQFVFHVFYSRCSERTGQRPGPGAPLLLARPERLVLRGPDETDEDLESDVRPASQPERDILARDPEEPLDGVRPHQEEDDVDDAFSDDVFEFDAHMVGVVDLTVSMVRESFGQVDFYFYFSSPTIAIATPKAAVRVIGRRMIPKAILIMQGQYRLNMDYTTQFIPEVSESFPRHRMSRSV